MPKVFNISFATHQALVDAVFEATQEDNLDFVLDELDYRLSEIDHHPKFSTNTFKNKDVFNQWKKQEEQRINGLIKKNEGNASRCRWYGKVSKQTFGCEKVQQSASITISSVFKGIQFACVGQSIDSRVSFTTFDRENELPRHFLQTRP
eukprot:TRINITY_DN3351_c0_g1_i1.p1 TRINITY_DN3351_c0_g1~~TRINITY_DN3351_c0_g1_i1.p1  ORF type:complete len:149 (-),score=40.32 TRINITY_DN3351_c0_g1_i1:157-603(-)